MQKKVSFSAQKTVLVLEALAIAMFLALLSKPLAEAIVFYSLIAVLSIIYIFVLVCFGKIAFGKDFKAYAVFFAFLFCVVHAAWIAQVAFARSIQDIGTVFVALVLVVLAFSFFFRAKFGKKHCEGTVISVEGGKVTIETDFDFLASSKKAVYKARATKSLKRGQKVKLKLTNLLWKTKAEIID